MPQDVSNINVITMLQRRIWGRGTGNAGEWEAITRGTQGKRLKNRSLQTCSCCVSNATLGLQSLQSLQIKPSVKTCDCWAVSNATLKSHNGEGKGEIKPKLAYWDYLAC